MRKRKIKFISSFGGLGNICVCSSVVKCLKEYCYVLSVCIN